MSTYPIAPETAKRAAEDYLAIRRAGMLPELQREIAASIEAHYGPNPYPWHCPANSDHREARLLDRWQRAIDPLRYEHEVAGDLAELLDCHTEAVEPYVVPALIDGDTKRTIVLDCLRNLANVARRELSRTRQRRAG